MAKYHVIGPHAVLGHAPGETFEADLDDPAFYLDAGHLALGKGEEPEKVECPYCRDERQLKRPPKFESHEEMVAHYEDKHPGFVPPAAEEVNTNG